MDIPAAHRVKFASFLSLIDDAKSGKMDVLLVAYPHVLGDTFEEVMVNLGLIAEAQIQFVMCSTAPGAPPLPKKKPTRVRA